MDLPRKITLVIFPLLLFGFKAAYAQLPALAGRTITPIYYCIDGGILLTMLPFNVPTAALPLVKYDFKVSVPFTRPWGTFALPASPVMGTMVPGACLIFPFPPVVIPAQIMLWNGSAPPFAP